MLSTLSTAITPVFEMSASPDGLTAVATLEALPTQILLFASVVDKPEPVTVNEGYVPVTATVHAPVKETVWSGAELVNVILFVPVFSEILNPVPAFNVTFVEPLVLEAMTLVVDVPEFTAKLPSLEILPSTSVEVIVKEG